MPFRRIMAAALLAAGIAAPATGTAQALYAASVRSVVGNDAIAGSLYTVTLATGIPTFVAPIRINGTTPVGLTGLAVHPTTGVFYGITSPLSSRNAQSLVSFDPATGNARLIGPLRHAGSDIAFNRVGNLFTWINTTRQLGYVDTSTGLVTPIGPPGQAGPPAGLAIDVNNVAYVTPGGAGGTLDTVDIATGLLAKGPQLTGAPFPAAINSMTFTPSGLLLAVNSNAGNPANTRLVTINVATGVVSNIGTLPDDTDGLAFSQVAPPDEAGMLWGMDVQTLALVGLGIIALVLGLIGWLVGRKPRLS